MRPRFFESYLLCLEQCPIYTRRLSSRQRGPEQSYLSRGTGQSYPPNQRQDVMSACESLGLKDKVVLGRADYKAVGARSGNGWQFSRKVIRFRRRAPWKYNPTARPELSGTSWGDPGSRSSAHSSARLPRPHRGARASSETASQDSVEEMLHRQAQWKDHQHTRPELPGTSWGDPGSRGSTT